MSRALTYYQARRLVRREMATRDGRAARSIRNALVGWSPVRVAAAQILERDYTAGRRGLIEGTTARMSRTLSDLLEEVGTPPRPEAGGSRNG